jgi:uncharacterized protein
MPTIEQARAWYQAADPVHGFDHVCRVMTLSERLGEELGANLEILRAAALLHDAVGAQPEQGGKRGRHEEQSAEFAREVLQAEGWQEEQIQAVLHCIRAHRFRGEEEPRSLEAKILFDADKLDVMGAFGAARTIGYAVQAGTPIYAEPSEHFMQTGETLDGEQHSAYHEYMFKLRKVIDRLYTRPARKLAVRRHEVLMMFFEQLDLEAHGFA